MVPSEVILKALDGVITEKALIESYDQALKRRGPRVRKPPTKLQNAYDEFLKTKDLQAFQDRMGFSTRSQVTTALGRMQLWEVEGGR